MDRVLQRRGALPSASIVGASHPPGVKRHRRPKIRSSQWPPVPRSRSVTASAPQFECRKIKVRRSGCRPIRIRHGGCRRLSASAPRHGRCWRWRTGCGAGRAPEVMMEATGDSWKRPFLSAGSRGIRVRAGRRQACQEPARPAQAGYGPADRQGAQPPHGRPGPGHREPLFVELTAEARPSHRSLVRPSAPSHRSQVAPST